MSQQLAQLSDLASLPGLPAAALAGISSPVQVAALNAASAYALGKIGSRYAQPLVSWDSDLTYAVCKIAVYDLLVGRGFNPAAGADPNIRMRRDDADMWLTSVARQEISPNIVGTVQTVSSVTPTILSLPLQGWERGRIS